MTTVSKHFVTFRSPGTFLAEETTKEIDSWDLEKAKEMVKDIKERYDAVPYCFFFTTRTRGENDLDSKQSDRSPIYFLGGKHGKVMTVEDVKAQNDPDNRILISNMENNGFDVYQTIEGWKFTVPFDKDDVLIDYEG